MGFLLLDPYVRTLSEKLWREDLYSEADLYQRRQGSILKSHVICLSRETWLEKEKKSQRLAIYSDPIENLKSAK